MAEINELYEEVEDRMESLLEDDDMTDDEADAIDYSKDDDDD